MVVEFIVKFLVETTSNVIVLIFFFFFTTTGAHNLNPASHLLTNFLVFT